jgi:hypothetical protein
VGIVTTGRLEPKLPSVCSPVDAALRRTPPGTLHLSIHRRRAVVELHVSGELDIATAPRLAEAMAWLRFRSCPATTILIDTSDVDFIAAAGYRALIAALVGPHGLWDPRVTLVGGPAVARLEAAISSASAGSAEQRRPPDARPSTVGPTAE